MSVPDIDGLAERHPGMDALFYLLSIDPSSFGKRIAYISDGQRTTHLLEVAGIRAYRKWDRDRRSQRCFNGARDKVAADLAQLVGVSVPATVLWQEVADFGCVQKEPPHFSQSLEYLMRAFKVAPEGRESIEVELAAAYDPMNVFFDVWVCNRDRHANYRNTLIAESSTSKVVWIIDFNCALGHLERPWTDDYFDQHGFDAGAPPVPPVIWKRPEWVANVEKVADNLQGRLTGVNENSVDEICSRAFNFYRCDGAEALSAQLANCLNRRKSKVKDWTCQLLGI